MTAAGERLPRPVLGSVRDYQFPAFDRQTMPNGLRVVVAPVAKLPLVTIAAIIDAGAICDPSGREGIAQLTARLLTEGTRSSDGGELSLRFERLGASVESYADWDVAMVSMTALSHQFERAVELLSEVLLEPAFPIRELERSKGERLADLLQLRAEPRGLADESFSRLVYAPASRYAKPDGGNEQTVPTIEREHVVEFFARRCRPASTTIVIAGDVKTADARRVLDAQLGDWRGDAPDSVAVDTTPARRDRAIWLVAKADAPQTELRIGHVGVARNHPDYFAIVVMNAILGGLFNSRINLNLREVHGYTYGAFSGFDWRRQAGPFAVSTAVRSDVTAPAVSEVLTELARIRESPVLADELSLAKSYLDGVFPIRYETTGAIATALANLTAFQLPDDYFNQYRANIRAVTADAVRMAAERYLDPGAAQIVAVGDVAAIRTQLEALSVGTVHVEPSER